MKSLLANYVCDLLFSNFESKKSVVLLVHWSASHLCSSKDPSF